MATDNDIFADIVPQRAGNGAAESDIFKDIAPAKAAPQPAVLAAPVQAATGRDFTQDARVAGQAAVKSIAGLPDMFLNAPQNIYNLGKAGFGSLATSIFNRPDLAPEITANAPDYVKRALTAVGAIRPENEPQDATQRLIAGVAGSGMGAALMPAATVAGMLGNVGMGAASGLAGAETQEVTGSPLAGMAASMATPVVLNAAGNAARNRMESLPLQQRQNAVRDQTLRDARGNGFVVAPSEINKSAINNALESIGGKAAVKQEAALRNQTQYNNAAVRDLGLPEGTPITRELLTQYRENVSAPYREIRQISPLANAAVDRLRDTRTDLQVAWRDYNRNQRTETYREIQQLQNRETMLERAIDRMATNSGNPQLLNDLRQARTLIAKSHDVERGLNVGDANVSGPALGRALDNYAPLSGRLEVAAKFQQGPGQKFSQEGGAVQSPGVSQVGMYGAPLIGNAASNALGPVGWLASGIPLLRGPVRSLLLSPAYQQAMATPNYQIGRTTRALSNIPSMTPQESVLLSLLNGARQ